MSVTYDDEPGPEGFERVSRDLAKGGASGRKAFLWLKRHAQQRPTNNNVDGVEGEILSAAKGDGGVMPIGEVVIAFGSSDPNGEEATEVAEQERAAVTAGGEGTEERRPVRVWERLDRSLSPSAAATTESGGGSEVFLWFRRVSEEEPLSWSAHSLAVRMLFCEAGRGDRGERWSMRLSETEKARQTRLADPAELQVPFGNTYKKGDWRSVNKEVFGLNDRPRRCFSFKHCLLDAVQPFQRITVVCWTCRCNRG